MGSLCRHVPNDGALTSLLTLCTCSKDVAYWLQRLWPAACVGDCVPLNSLPPRNPGVVDRGSRGAAFASRQGTEVSDGSSLLSQCTALHGVVVPPIPGDALLMLVPPIPGDVLLMLVPPISGDVLLMLVPPIPGEVLLMLDSTA